MAAIDNLTGNVAALATAVDALVAAIPASQEPAIQAAADSVAALTAKVVAATPVPAA